jgi:hypothetical protein
MAWTALPTAIFLISNRTDRRFYADLNVDEKVTLNKMLSTTEDRNTQLEPENAPLEARDLLRLSKIFANRAEGAQYVWMLLTEINRQVAHYGSIRRKSSIDSVRKRHSWAEGMWDNEKAREMGSKGKEYVNKPARMRRSEKEVRKERKRIVRNLNSEKDGTEEELEMLVRATKMLDLNLSYEGPRL